MTCRDCGSRLHVCWNRLSGVHRRCRRCSRCWCADGHGIVLHAKKAA